MSAASTCAVRGTWRTYTPSDGLAALKCEHLIEDRQGYLWIATCTGGISRFDGEEFTTFTVNDGLCGIQVYSVIEDRRGRIWCGTFDGGLCWFDGRRFHWIDTRDALSGNAITYVFEDRQGRIWCAGPTLIGYVDGNRFHNLFAKVQDDCGLSGRFPATEYFGVAQDAVGDMWFGGNSRLGLLHYDGRRFERIMPQIRGEATHFFPVHADADGTVWVGGDGTHLWRIVDGDFHPHPLDLAGTHNIRKIQTDGQGGLWLCTLGNGAFCLKDDGLRHYTQADGLAFDAVNGMLEDREGLLWFATWGGGLSCHDPHSIRFHPRKQRSGASPPPRPSAGSPLGHQFADDRQARAFAFESGRLVDLAAAIPAETGWHALHQDDLQQIWLGAEDGLRLYRDGSFETIDADLLDGPIHAIDDHRCGGLLLGGLSQGRQLQLLHWDGHQTKPLYTLPDPTPRHQHISAIYQTASGDIWFGTNTLADHGRCHGLYRLGPSEHRLYTLADGLPDQRIADLLEDGEGTLWIATLGGLSRYDGRSFTTFTTDQGLPNNHIRCLHLDTDGRLWLGSESGVIRHHRGSFQPVLPQHIGPTRKITSGPDGSLWCGTARGLVEYRPGTTPPRVRIDRLVADQTHDGTEVGPILTTASQVTVEYRGMCLRSLPRHLLYQYRLVGKDADWQLPTRRRQAIYRQLPPGDYTFRIRAIDCDFNASPPAETRFTVQPDPLVQGLHQALSQTDTDCRFIGHSAALERVNSQLAKVAATDLSVLVLGETGTGKGLAARALHTLSRRSGAFIQVNCGAIPAGLVESELFGHEKGSFTGANARQLGKFELAAGGTLFLDEIGDMPLDMQRVLLQVLQERTFHRVGGRTLQHSDARIIAATNRDLAGAVGRGEFREDLYYRLGAFEVRLPPLRQRREDIPPLVAHFAARFAHHLHRPAPSIQPTTLDRLCAYDWPGNVRELEHIVQRAVLLCQQDTIRAEDLGQLAPLAPTAPAAGTAPPPDLLSWLARQKENFNSEDLLDNADELLIRAALAQAKGNKTEAAKLLGTGRKRIERRAKKYRIDGQE